jgi:hypothetical protein
VEAWVEIPRGCQRAAQSWRQELILTGCARLRPLPQPSFRSADEIQYAGKRSSPYVKSMMSNTGDRRKLGAWSHLWGGGGHSGERGTR